jgi:hypothetical protein
VGLFALWVLASLLGGAAGGVGLILSFFGQLVLFGGIVGLAQTFALLPYLRGAWVWAVASFFGWIAGSLLGAFDYLYLPKGLANSEFLFFAAGWCGMAIAQGVVLLITVLSSEPPAGQGRRALLLPALAWFPMGLLGGAVAGAASLTGTFLPSASGGMFGGQSGGILYDLAPSIAAEAAAGAIYGAATGTVLVWLLRALAGTTPCGGSGGRGEGEAR